MVNEKLKKANKQLSDDLEKGRAQIKAMAGRLTELSSVEDENIRLKQQLDKITAELSLTKAELDKYILNNPTAHPKVIPLDKLVNVKCNTKCNNNKLAEMLAGLDIKVVPKLSKIAETKTKQEIKNAIFAGQEYISTGKPVKSKVNLILKAIEEEWNPNFSEWFQLAQQKGWDLAS